MNFVMSLRFVIESNNLDGILSTTANDGKSSGQFHPKTISEFGQVWHALRNERRGLNLVGRVRMHLG
jgi:hypothetical protein